MSGIAKSVTRHILTHCLPTLLLQSGTDIRTTQSLLGHSSAKPTMIPLHLLNRPAAASPSDLH